MHKRGKFAQQDPDTLQNKQSIRTRQHSHMKDKNEKKTSTRKAHTFCAKVNFSQAATASSIHCVHHTFGTVEEFHSLKKSVCYL